ncbi:hypothetical protein [Spiroplasma endosymbiont of Virgichneumon dumeticola]|uniref:hypothetical protein n=1 Tax=Spiroplasma endosymbiont of Virgichneumon dumeticola TaxID=3139323 RepID=UPI0035C8FFF3
MEKKTILENLNIITEKILNTIKLYERNNEILDEITINKNNYSNEEIENIKDAIIEQNKNIKYFKRTIFNLKQKFKDGFQKSGINYFNIILLYF